MDRGKKNILCVNGGSSSIKFSVYAADGGDLNAVLKGKIDRIGLSGASLTFTDNLTGEEGRVSLKESGMKEAAGTIEAAGMKEAANFLLDWLRERMEAGAGDGVSSWFSGIGHRVVHGGTHRQPVLIDDALLAELERISGYDPDHLPGEIGLIRLFRERDAGLRQVACFDTAFHATLPRVARLMPLPRRYEGVGIQRYGFHGLSYAYLAEELIRIAGPEVAGGRVIMAHLGSGASLAAVRDGQSVDTTMGFTPTGGIMMGTRTGDLDPGVIWWILQQEGLGAAQLSDLVNHQSGLLGVSGVSSDMQDLLARESRDAAVAEAVEMFCYQIRKSIGAYTAVLDGVDALVFAGGIGERSPVIRSRVCAGMGYLGIVLDQRANERNDLLISRPEGPVRVYAIPTDEERMIALYTKTVLYDSNY
jgi:acetate kinase